MNREVVCFDAVAPARERGLKFKEPTMTIQSEKVAPARERGLKLPLLLVPMAVVSRSREGAWIEIAP